MRWTKGFIITMICSLLFGITANSAIVFAAGESVTVEKNEVLKRNQGSFEYNEQKDTIEFSSEKAVANGVNKADADNAANYFNSLNDEDKKEVLKSFNYGSRFRVAPAIAWAVSVLGGWLAEKLLDYGATKFCKHYRKVNNATRMVCNVIA